MLISSEFMTDTHFLNKRKSFFKSTILTNQNIHATTPTIDIINVDTKSSSGSINVPSNASKNTNSNITEKTSDTLYSLFFFFINSS